MTLPRLIFVLLFSSPLLAQEPPSVPPATPPRSAPAPAADNAQPLPEIHALMQEVEAHQRAAEAAQQDYTYRQLRTLNELDGQGQVKKTTVGQYDIFWLNGVEIAKLLTENGVVLNPDAQKKQSVQIDKEVAVAEKRRAKADAEGKTTDSHGRPTFEISQLLATGIFTNERRETVDGRPTILVDFTGEPKAPYPNLLVNVQGSLAIDEGERAIVSAEGTFIHSFTLLGGMLMKIDQGTTFAYQTVRINDEVWLPASYHLEGEARILLLFSGHVRFDEVDSDFRKFKTNVKILPGYTPVEQPPPPNPIPPQNDPS